MNFGSGFPSIDQSINSTQSASVSPSQPTEFIDNSLKLSALREEGKQELIDIIQSLRGRKCLVVEPQLGNILNLLIQDNPKILKDNGVQYFRELRGELGDFVSDTGRDIPENIVYIVRPNLTLMKAIAKQIQSYLKLGKLFSPKIIHYF